MIRIEYAADDAAESLCDVAWRLRFPSLPRRHFPLAAAPRQLSDASPCRCRHQRPPFRPEFPSRDLHEPL